jgi:hypothetical protein
MQDVIWFGRSQVFNPFSYEASLHGGLDSLSIDNVVSGIREATNCVRRTRGRVGGSGDAIFFEDMRDIGLKELCFADIMAHGDIDVSRWLRMAQTLPNSIQDLEDHKLYSLQVLAEAKRNTPASRQRELDQCIRWFEEEVPRWGDRMKSSVVAEMTTTLDIFQREPVYSLMCGNSTVTPDDAVDRGKIIALDLPASGGESSRLINCMWKTALQRKIAIRHDGWTGDEDLMPPVACISDDAQAYCTPSDAAFQGIHARSGRYISVVITQALSSLKNTLGREGADGDNLVNEFVLNHGVKVFANNDDMKETNLLASDLIGKHKVRRPGGSTHLNSPEGGTITWHETDEYYFRPEQFRSLRTGGPAHRNKVDSVVLLPGVPMFSDGNPYLTVEFDQNDPGRRWGAFWEKRAVGRVWANHVSLWEALKEGRAGDWTDFWTESW